MLEATIITGATCTGKSAKAIDLAEKIDAEIISCDSVQIYKGMNVGAAKPSKEELARVPHHLIDVAEVSEIFDVAKYAQLAKQAAENILKRGKKIIVAGGSGFYLKAWFCAVTDQIEISQEIKNFADKIAENGNEALAQALLKIDPKAAEFLDIKNPRRTRNALMRCISSGKNVEQLQKDFAKLECPIGEIKREVILLDLPDETLLERIKSRTAAMIENGLIEETRILLKNDIEKNPSAACAIGYRETINWLKNNSKNTSALAEEISKNTFSLVKKQRKFFRTQLGPQFPSYPPPL